MQIKRLHRNIYRLYAYARTQECLDVYRKKYQHQVQRWEKLESEGVSLKLKQEIVGIIEKPKTKDHATEIIEIFNK